MSSYSPSIEKLIESFEKLPSIGHKTAIRLAFHMLDLNEEETNEFINSITDAKKKLKYCSTCFNTSINSTFIFSKSNHKFITRLCKSI